MYAEILAQAFHWCRLFRLRRGKPSVRCGFGAMHQRPRFKDGIFSMRAMKEQTNAYLAWSDKNGSSY